MQVHYCIVKGKMLPLENGSKEAESQLSQWLKKKKGKWGEREKKIGRKICISLYIY